MRSKWGQNFLAEAGVARRIVAALGAGPSDGVLEIGPGRGALTQFLVGTTQALTAVELDRRLAEDLPYLFLYYPEALPTVRKRLVGPQVAPGRGPKTFFL